MCTEQILGDGVAAKAVITTAPVDTLAAWIGQGRTVATNFALQFVARVSKTLFEAHQHGLRHGTLSMEQIALIDGTDEWPGNPVLCGLLPSHSGVVRREDVAADVAALAEVARALLFSPARPVPGGKGAPRGAQTAPRPSAADWQSRPEVSAVIAAGLDRQEGVFLFDSPLAFTAALEEAVAAEKGARPRPGLRAERVRLPMPARKRRRLIKVLAGAALTCLALLAMSGVMATRDRPAAGARAPAPSTTEQGRVPPAEDSYGD